MSAVAAIPSLALLAGCAAGLLFPGIPHPALHAALALSVAAALLAWRGSPRLLLAVLVCAFFAGGAALAERAWDAAWRPPLRSVFDAAVGAARAEALAEHRAITEDIAVPMGITGVLRSDASPSDAGATMNVDVEEPAAGGVTLTVLGDFARAHIDEWRAGRRIRTTAQLRRPSRYLDPGVVDAERALARRGTTLVGTVKSGSLVEVVSPGSVASECAASLRAFVRRAVGASVGTWDPQAAAIVTAIVIGDRAGLDDRVQQSLQEAGTYHVIAISGGNIAILAGLTLVAFRVAGVLGRAAMLSAIGGLVAYGYLVGGGASVDRATLMAVVYFGSRAIDQRSPPHNTLAVVAGLLAAADPLAVADPAFLLTFGATAAILTFMPALTGADALPKRLMPAIALLGASAASEAALLPVSAAVFSRVTFAGLALNFAAIPLMAVAQVAGMALVPLAVVSSRAATLVGWVACGAARGLVWSAGLVRYAPSVTWRVAAPGWPVIALYYGGLIGGWISWRVRWRFPVRTVFAVTFLGAAFWLTFEPWSYAANKGDGRLHVTFVDVGQGDAAFIRFPRGGTFLVDTGGVPGSFDVGDRVVAPVLRDAGLRRLQTIVLTHGDNDHIGGAPSLMREFTPGDVWEGIPVPPLEPLQERRAIASDMHARWTNVQTADQTTIDGVRVVVRHPVPADWERQRVRNDDSIVLELMWKNVSVVLTGDAGADTERLIAQQFAPSALRIVKVPHHGSLSASTPEFLRALAPRIAVVSVGRSNTFGHPSPVVLDRYHAVGAEIFRTDQDGAVVVDTDGLSAHVRTFTGRSLDLASLRN